jgi:hypothetical protein
MEVHLLSVHKNLGEGREHRDGGRRKEKGRGRRG